MKKYKFFSFLLAFLFLATNSLQSYEQTAIRQEYNTVQTDSLLKSVPYIKNPKVSAYIYADRFLNELAKRDLHKILGRYKFNDPSTTTFELPAFEVPSDQVDIYLDGSNPELANRFYSSEIALMYVHPINLEQEKIDNFKELNKLPKHVIEVTPTCTSRTLVALEHEMESYFIKTHLPFVLDGTERKDLFNSEIKHEIKVSKELGSTNLSYTFAYLREPIGMAWKNRSADQQGWGYIVREMEASPKLNRKTYMVPMFSLYSRDSLAEGELPLLWNLIDQSNEEPKVYVLNHIMYPVFDSFVEAIKKMGFVLLSHGQNVLFELNSDFTPTGRIIHRDFGVEVDAKQREKLNLQTDIFDPAFLFNLPNQDEPAGQRYSLFYDNGIGRHLFDDLSTFLENYYGISKEELRQDFLKHFKEQFPDFADYFITNNVYRSTGGVKVVSDKPNWRPLIEPSQ